MKYLFLSLAFLASNPLFSEQQCSFIKVSCNWNSSNQTCSCNYTNDSGLNRNIELNPTRSCDKTCIGTKYCKSNPNFMISCNEGDF